MTQQLWRSSKDNLLEAAQEFAARYWDEPRLIENNHLMPDDSMQFGVVNGTKVYEARLNGGHIFINRLD